MKNISYTALVLSVVAFLNFSCSSIQSKEKKMTTEIDTVSYYIGLFFGNQVKQGIEQNTADVELDIDLVLKGIKDKVNDAEIEYTDEQIGKYLNNYFTQKQQEQAVAKKEEGKKFLEENKNAPGVFETESGLQFKIVKEGTGKQPTAESTVKCHYEGRLLDGTIFDSSYERGNPAQFALNRVIKGWTEGLQLMKEGAEYEFYIPSELAYGPQGTRGIPGNSVLIFKVELLEVVE